MSTDAPHLQPVSEVTFSLATRLTISGSIAVVLHLHRDKALTHRSTLMVCERQAAARVVETCRGHLRRLGIAETGHDVQPHTLTAMPEPRPPPASERRKQPMRLPLAASL